MIAKNSKNTKRRRPSFAKISIILAVLFGIIFLFSVNWQIWQRRQELENKMSQLKKEIAEAQKNSEDLKKNIAGVGTEDYLEKVAKEQLGLKKIGEEVMVINKENRQTNNNSQPQANKNIFYRLWNLIWGK